MNDDDPSYALDHAWARRSFGRAGTTYDAAAVLQRDVRDSLLQRLELTALNPAVVLDAGAGTGHATSALKRRYPGAVVIALDSALGMLRSAGRQRSWLRRFERVCADAQRLPLADASVDLIVSSLMLQWTDPDAVFAECRRVLKPRGSLSFASLGPDTLRELRDAWSRVDTHSRVSRFIDMHDLGDALVRAGFAAPVLDVERYTLKYTTVAALVADLKAIGARNATQGRPRGLTSPRKFAAMQAEYEKYRQDGRLPATYEVVFGQAWTPASDARRPGSEPASVSLEDIKRQLKMRRDPG